MLNRKNAAPVDGRRPKITLMMFKGWNVYCDIFNADFHTLRLESLQNLVHYALEDGAGSLYSKREALPLE